MKTRFDPPGTKRVKKNSFAIGRFIRVIFVPELAARVVRVKECVEFTPECFKLMGVKNSASLNEAVIRKRVQFV